MPFRNVAVGEPALLASVVITLMRVAMQAGAKMTSDIVFGDWSDDDVVVVELSESEWRVSDLRRREADGMAVLGFIEHTGRGYEATALDRPHTRPEFTRFHGAVQYLEGFCLDGPARRRA